jgi:hypothetical protein
MVFVGLLSAHPLGYGREACKTETKVAITSQRCDIAEQCDGRSGVRDRELMRDEQTLI